MTSSILYDLSIIVPEDNILEKFNTVVKRNYETIKLNNIQNQETLRGYNSVPFIDGKMYIGVGYLEEIAEIFNMNINIDYSNRSIYLSNKILN